MDQGVSQDYQHYNNTYSSYNNGPVNQPNCEVPTTMLMTYPQQQISSISTSQGHPHLHHQSQQHQQQHYPHSQQQMQPNHHPQSSQILQQQQNGRQMHQHHNYHHQQAHSQQSSQQNPNQQHPNQQQMQMSQQQYAQHHTPQNLSMNQHQQQNAPATTQNYPINTVSSTYNSYSTSSGGSSTTWNYSNPLPVGASLLNPTHILFQPKQEPPTYPMMTGKHLTFEQLAAIGNSQDTSIFCGSHSNQTNGTQHDFSSTAYTSPAYTQSYRDNYESGSPESGNSSSPPTGVQQGEYVEGTNMGMYNGSPNVSPPKSSYGYGTGPDGYAPSSTAGPMGSQYVYAPTDSPPYPIPQIKTETSSPCSTPHQTSHIDTHPYARPSPGSSPRVVRRMQVDPNAVKMANSPSQAGCPSQTGSPGSSRRAHVLPPCKVCGVQATGFHYGVNTCEACKGFFRRSIIRKEEYTCLKSNKCNIEPGKRNLCGHCRYQKCLEAGMSVEGIKTGRYTYQKRTKDILELQQLKKEQSQARNQESKRMKELQTNDLLLKVMDVAKNHPDIVNLHDAIRMQQKYLEEKQMLTDLFGKMERVNSEDYVYALENLGLELDDRREITNQLIEEMNGRMPLLYAVMRELPGMENISYNDVNNLFKFSYIDIWLIARARMFNLSEGIFTTPNGVSFDFATVFGQNAAETVQRLAVKLTTYSYTVEEKMLLVGVVYLSTDRVFIQLEDRETIDRVRETYIEALEIQLPGNHPDVEHIFAKTLQLIADLRTVTQAVYNGLRGLLKYTNAKKYPLVHDILTVR